MRQPHGRRCRRPRLVLMVAAGGVSLALPAVARADGLAVVPILIGPLQVLLTVLPAILIGIVVAIAGTVVAMFRPAALKAAGRLLWRKKLPVLVFLAGLAGVIYGVGYLRSAWAGNGGAVRTDLSGADWWAYRGGPQRRGAVPGGPDPVAGGVQWAFTEFKTFYSSPAVVGSRVFVSAADKGLFSDRGAIYCLDALGGGVVWKYAPKGFRATYSSPAVAGGYLVCGEGLHFTRDARITCLDAATGKKLWEYRTASHVESSPAIAEGRVYIGAGDDGLYCIALKPGPEGKANVLWHLPGEKYPDCETSPIVHAGKVYFGLGEGGHAVVCVEAATGKELWRTEAPYPVFGSPAIADGKVFVGMGNGNMIESAEAVRDKHVRRMKQRGASQAEIDAAYARLGPAGEVWALDLQTGKVLWRYKLKRTVLGTIAAADGKLYFGSRDGVFHCLTTDGRLVDRLDVHEPIVTSPAVGAQHVYFVTETGRLYAVNREDFSDIRWQAAVGTAGPFLSSPVVAGGRVYVGTSADGFVCIGTPVAEKGPALWAGHLGGPGRSGWADRDPLPERGSFAWRYPKTDSAAEEPSATAKVHAPVALADGALYVGVEAGEKVGLARLTPPRKRRQPPKEEWFYPTANPVYESPAVRGKCVFIVDGRPGQKGRHLHCLDAASGRVVWKRPVADDAPAALAVGADRLMVADAADGLSCLTFGGDEQSGIIDEAESWRTTGLALVGRPALTKDLVLVATADPPAAAALDVVEGGVLWRTKLPAGPTTGPIWRGELVAVGTAEGIAILGLWDGELRTFIRCGKVAGSLVADRRHVAATTVAGEAVICTWEGQQVASAKDVLPGLAPMLVRDRALLCRKRDLAVLRLPGGQVKRWMRTSWLGGITAPPVLAGSHLYFGTGRKGLVCVRPKR